MFIQKKPLIGITMELSAKKEQLLNFLNLAYAEAVEEAGGNAIYLPTILSPSKLQEILSMTDGLIFTGGADIHPSYYGEQVSAPNQPLTRSTDGFRLAFIPGSP
ncbi:MAG: gamma-glutamyl-gamma-aminobutyrate hydrolase family protein [Deltaproteobacteria bacterium]|nr:gamma-glutamyl-gamma-aminobutyrate hydrolase family protein [Deltaproteobacteria bacterium]